MHWTLEWGAALPDCNILWEYGSDLALALQWRCIEAAKERRREVLMGISRSGQVQPFLPVLHWTLRASVEMLHTHRHA